MKINTDKNSACNNKINLKFYHSTTISIHFWIRNE